MNADYLIPVGFAIASLAAWLALLCQAWLRRPAALAEKTRPLRSYLPEQRESYHLSRRKVLLALGGSALGAAVAALALAAWLPLPPLEKTLIATLAMPLLWPVLLVILVTRSWRPSCVLGVLASALLLSLLLLAPFVGL